MPMMLPNRRFDVFVSYSTEDLDFARLVARAVGVMGFRVFLADKTLNPGDQLGGLGETIRHARLLVLLWSEAASKSEWVREEVGAAWGAGVPVIPALLTRGLQLPPSLRATGVKYQEATARDAESVLNIQAAVIAWWQNVLAVNAAQRAALEEQRKAQQAEATNKLLGLAGAGVALWALSNAK